MSNTNDMLNDPEILRELIMDHYQYPHNHKLTEEADYKSVHMASDSCIDDITVQSKIKDGKIIVTKKNAKMERRHTAAAQMIMVK